MPWLVNKNGDKYCVYKKEGGKKRLLKGGCHSTREQAMKQVTAIRISEHAKNTGD